jgi:hypothetical protein
VKIRTSIIAASAAVVLGTTGALVLPAVASAHSSTTTLKFISVMKKSVQFTKSTGAQQDTDQNATGKTIGFDVIYFSFISSTTANVNVTLDTKGGFLYGTGKQSNSGFSNGKVTGGTGSFKGATGTITAKPISSTKTAVTITYSV